MPALVINDEFCLMMSRLYSDIAKVAQPLYIEMVIYYT